MDGPELSHLDIKGCLQTGPSSRLDLRTCVQAPGASHLMTFGRFQNARGAPGRGSLASKTWCLQETEGEGSAGRAAMWTGRLQFLYRSAHHVAGRMKEEEKEQSQKQLQRTGSGTKGSQEPGPPTPSSPLDCTGHLYYLKQGGMAPSVPYRDNFQTWGSKGAV